RHGGPGWLTWVGFEKTPEGARVFVRLSSPLRGSVGQARAGQNLVVTLPGYKVDSRNDGRPPDTRYFDTNVVRVGAQPTKVGVELHISFKQAANEAKVSTGQAPDGEMLVYLDF